MMRNFVLVLLCALVAASVVVESNSSPLDLEMKAMRAGQSTTSAYEFRRLATLQRKHTCQPLCLGYMLTNRFLATRARCILVPISSTGQESPPYISDHQNMEVVLRFETDEDFDILFAYYPPNYQFDNIRSPADFSILKIKSYDWTEISRSAIPIRANAIIPPGAALKMLTKTHLNEIKQFDVQYTDNKNCNNGLEISSSSTFENQMCVRILFEKYLEIQGNYVETASSSSDTKVIGMFATGSPILYGGKLVGLVSDYHIREEEFLNIHCTQLAQFSNIIGTNLKLNLPRNWYSYPQECSEDSDGQDLEDWGISVQEQTLPNRRN